MHAGRKRSLVACVASIGLTLVALFFACRWHNSSEQVVSRLRAAGAKVTVGKNEYFGKPRTMLDHVSAGFRPVRPRDQSAPDSVQFERRRERRVLLHELPWLQNVHFVRIDQLPFEQADVRYLLQLPRLDSLEFRQTDLDDSSLEIVSRIPTLEILELSGSKVSDSGIECLVNLPRLQVLRLNDTEISDAGIPHILELNSLRCLWVQGTNVSPQGVRQLKQMHNLRVLMHSPGDGTGQTTVWRRDG